MRYKISDVYVNVNCESIAVGAALGEENKPESVIATDGFPRIDVLAKPIVDWLKMQDPYLEIHISSEYIKVVRINESIPVSEAVSPQNQLSQTRY